MCPTSFWPAHNKWSWRFQMAVGGALQNRESAIFWAISTGFSPFQNWNLCFNSFLFKLSNFGPYILPTKHFTHFSIELFIKLPNNHLALWDMSQNRMMTWYLFRKWYFGVKGWKKYNLVQVRHAWNNISWFDPVSLTFDLLAFYFP